MNNKLKNAVTALLEADENQAWRYPTIWEPLVQKLRDAIAELESKPKPIAWLEREHVVQLQRFNGMSVWAESPQMYAPYDPYNTPAPPNLVAVYLIEQLKD